MSAYCARQPATIVPLRRRRRAARRQRGGRCRSQHHCTAEAAEMAKRARHGPRSQAFVPAASGRGARQAGGRRWALRDRAARRAWLLRIHNEVERFFRRIATRDRARGRRAPRPEAAESFFGRIFRGKPETVPIAPTIIPPVQRRRRMQHSLAAYLLAALAGLGLWAMPATAMVGGAPPAEQTIARHVVLIVGGHPLPGSRLRPISCSRPRIAC
jgi:hypothetical protein